MSGTSKSTRVAIVIGASGAIGGAVARRIARDGIAVVAHYGGNKDAADALAAAITADGGAATTAGADVADESQMAEVFRHADATFGGIDVVINTAGIMPLAPIAQMDLDTFDRIQRINVRGTFISSRLAAREVRPGGAIINFSTSITPDLRGVRGLQGCRRGDDPDPRP